MPKLPDSPGGQAKAQAAQQPLVKHKAPRLGSARAPPTESRTLRAKLSTDPFADRAWGRGSGDRETERDGKESRRAGERRRRRSQELLRKPRGCTRSHRSSRLGAAVTGTYPKGEDRGSEAEALAPELTVAEPRPNPAPPAPPAEGSPTGPGTPAARAEGAPGLAAGLAHLLLPRALGHLLLHFGSRLLRPTALLLLLALLAHRAGPTWSQDSRRGGRRSAARRKYVLAGAARGHATLPPRPAPPPHALPAGGPALTWPGAGCAGTAGGPRAVRRVAGKPPAPPSPGAGRGEPLLGAPHLVTQLGDTGREPPLLFLGPS